MSGWFWLGGALIVVPLNLEVGYPTAALGCRNPAMSQEVLHGDAICNDVQQLSSHGVSEEVTASLYTAFVCITLMVLSDLDIPLSPI
jgi:hypothetical protein